MDFFKPLMGCRTKFLKIRETAKIMDYIEYQTGMSFIPVFAGTAFTPVKNYP